MVKSMMLMKFDENINVAILSSSLIFL